MQAARMPARKPAMAAYHLRDLRKKGLTEEFLSQGENDKGGHETQAMRNHYRLIKPPKRARTTIRFEREQKLPKLCPCFQPASASDPGFQIFSISLTNGQNMRTILSLFSGLG